jgi:hypothetical protein
MTTLLLYMSTPRPCPTWLRERAEKLAREKDITFATALRWIARGRRKKKHTPAPTVAILERQKLF